MAKNKTLYRSIEELPIYNWFKIQNTNNLGWLNKGIDSPEKEISEELIKVWDGIFSEFIDTFGIPEKLKEILELKRDIQCLQWEMLITDDGSLETFIDIKQYELEQKTKVEGKSSKINEAKVYLEKFMGFRINEREITVKEYYEYMQVLNKEAEHPATSLAHSE